MYTSDVNHDMRVTSTDKGQEFENTNQCTRIQ